MSEKQSHQASLNGADLEYWDLGSGPPILFIHGGMGAECSAVLREPALRDRFRLIHFQRRGYGRSSCPGMPVSIAQQSRDCQALMEHLGVPVAHVVGQSYGGAISLQLTSDAPALVRSLTVLEPALPSVIFSCADFAARGQHAGALYQQGRHRECMEQFGRAVIGDRDWPAFSNQWLDRWVEDAKIIFESDFPALETWSYGQAEASRISQPVLNLVGANSPETFERVWKVMAEWVPQVRNEVVTETSHCILQANPRRAADLIVEHVKRHPI